MAIAAIVDGVRTPFAKAGTVLKDQSVVDLGCTVTKELLARNEFDPRRLTEVIFGNVSQPADSANVARVIALFSGIPWNIPAFSVHRNCASSIESVVQGARMIWHEGAEAVLVGGVESMSNIPLMFNKKMKGFFEKLMSAKTPFQKLRALLRFRPSFLAPEIALVQGLTDPYVEMIMGLTADRVAKDFKITRQEQDAYALESHRRAVRSMKNGIFAEEIVPVYTKDGVVLQDKGPREDQSLEKLASLKPYFDRKYGTVTVGNACPVTDGGVALLLMNAEKAKAEGREILGTIKSYAFAALDPSRMGLGPAFAIPIALERAGLRLEELDVIELNEAFAAQVLGCLRAMDSETFCREKMNRPRVGLLDPARINVNGGAIALGHPVGATGGRIILTALKELKRKGGRYALASLCVGGGQGAAVVLERGA